MGVDFYCGDYLVHFTYSGWDKIRIQIINSTFSFIVDKFTKDQINYANLPEEHKDYVGEDSSYRRNMNEIIELIKLMEETQKSISNMSETNVMTFIKVFNNDVSTFVNACNKFSYIDSLIYFDIYGLYALCNKSDCEGYYSPGNSSDICRLFDSIKPFINEELYEIIYEEEKNSDLYGLFKESETKKLIVTIC